MSELRPPIEMLFGAPGGDDLPPRLAALYGGGLGLPERVVYANFVSSIDGIAAIADRPASSTLISGRDQGDRFVMALLRAAADVVLIGAGTYREHRGPWTAAASYPDTEQEFADLRRREGRSAEPRLAIVTASGAIEPKAATPLEDAIVLTTSKGVAAIPTSVADAAEVVVLGDEEELEGAAIVRSLSDRGFRRILTEGGPRLVGRLLASHAVDELFLTISPVVAGEGDRPGERSTLAPGVELLPDERMLGQLRSARRRGSFLFLRYGLGDGGSR